MRHAPVDWRAKIGRVAPVQFSPAIAVRGSKLVSSSYSLPLLVSFKSQASARRSDALAPSPSPRGVLNICANNSPACAAFGFLPKTCSPSRICSSFRSHKKLSSFNSFSSGASSLAMPQSAVIPARSACSKISLSKAAERFLSMPAASKYSSISDSIMAITPCVSACVKGGVK